MTTIRIELRIVIAPRDELSKEQALLFAQQAILAIGPIFDVNVKEYEKPQGSFMMCLEVNSTRSALELVDELIAGIGGVGWITSGSGDEIEAIWEPQSGGTPPVDVGVIWAYVQSIPISALPPGRREKGTRSAH